MTIISLDPQEARQTAASFTSGAQRLNQELNVMQGAAQQVLGSWEGSSKHQFEEHWGRWHQQLQTLLEELERFGQGLKIEAEQFEAADQAFGT